MKKNIHPENYRLVVFKDLSCDYSFLTKSTVETKDTVVCLDQMISMLVLLRLKDLG